LERRFPNRHGPPDADSFGCGFHNVLFFLGQAVERIHQLVYLPLQRARVRLGIALLRREDAVNQFDERFLLISQRSKIFAGFALFAVKRFRLVGSLAPPCCILRVLLRLD